MNKFISWFYDIYKKNINFKIIYSLENNKFLDYNYIINIYIDKDNYKIHSNFCHKIIGGNSILYLNEIMSNSSKKSRISKQNYFYSLLLTPYFLYERPYKNKSEIKHNLIKMKIFSLKLYTSIEGSQYEILYNVAIKVYNSFLKKCNNNFKYIYFYITRGFINKKKSPFNNIGIIFIKFNPKEIKSWKDLKKYIKTKKYHKYVSNMILNYNLIPKNGSKNIRFNTDFNISNTYINNDKDYITNTSYTYINKNELFTPLYISINTFKNIKRNKNVSYINFTVHTDKFTPTPDMKELKINNNYILE